MKRAVIAFFPVVAILAINACTNNPVAPVIQYITTWNKVDGVIFQKEAIGGFSTSPTGPVTYGKALLTFGIDSGQYAYSFTIYATNNTANWNIGDLIYRSKEYGTVAIRIDETNKTTVVIEIKLNTNIVKSSAAAYTTNIYAGPFSNPFRKKLFRDYDGSSVLLSEWSFSTNSAAAAIDQTNAPYASLWMKQ